MSEDKKVIIVSTNTGSEVPLTEEPTLQVETPQDSAVYISPSELNAVVEKVQEDFKAVLIDTDKLIEEDATALGLTGGSSDGGHSFVDLVRIAESVEGVGYDFPLNPSGTPPEIEGIHINDVLPPEDVEIVVNIPPPEDPEDPCHGNSGHNNGWGNGDQDAPGNSGPHNNAENGPNPDLYPGNSDHLNQLIHELTTHGNPHLI